MDVKQLEQKLRLESDLLAKNEQELLMLMRKVNDLKRKIPEGKRKVEGLKRDMLAQAALTRRRQTAAEQGKNTT
jgi:hypothetical protein